MVLTTRKIYCACLSLICCVGFGQVTNGQIDSTVHPTPVAVETGTPSQAQPVSWPPVVPEPKEYFIDLEDEPFGDQGEAIEFTTFPEEHAPLRNEIIESVPHLLELPMKPLTHAFGALIGGEHVEPHSALDEHPIGIQPIVGRPPLLIEWGEEFLAPGWLDQGVELPTGAVWRPAFWVFGTYRTAIQTYEGQRAGDPAVEWANRLDLFGQLNLTGTERLLIGMRPLDDERISSRQTTGYDLRSGDPLDGWNADFQTLFFEGDFGEIFPFLDPHDTRFLDYGFSVGRQPILAQQGLLIAEDRIDAVTLTRNTLNGNGNLNMRVTGVYAWNSIHRNSSVGQPNTYDNDSQMYAILTESDYFERTVNADIVYVTSNEQQFGDLAAVGLSSIARHHGYENTYNTSLHMLISWPTNGETPFAQQGELLFAQTSWTPHHTNDLVYVNGFWAIDQFTSPTRGPFNGSALGLTGLLFAAPGIGRAGAPLAVSTNDVAGATLGYQMFYDETRQQVIWELGGFRGTKGPDQRGAIATGVRWQKAMGQHFVLVVDGFTSKLEGTDLFYGARTELQVQF